MSYYSNEDLDNWKENHVIYTMKFPSRKELTDFHNKYCGILYNYMDHNNDLNPNSDPTSGLINWMRTNKLYERYMKHKEAWKSRKEKEFYEKYPNINLKILEVK